GADLADRLRDAQDTLNKRFTAVIAADYGKLRTVALCALGVSGCPGDPDEWQLTRDQQTRIGQGLLATLRTSFYGTLLSAKYSLWTIPAFEPATDARYWAGNGVAVDLYPFKDVPDTGQFAIPHCRDMGD